MEKFAEEFENSQIGRTTKFRYFEVYLVPYVAIEQNPYNIIGQTKIRVELEESQIYELVSFLERKKKLADKVR